MIIFQLTKPSCVRIINYNIIHIFQTERRFQIKKSNGLALALSLLMEHYIGDEAAGAQRVLAAASSGENEALPDALRSIFGNHLRQAFLNACLVYERRICPDSSLPERSSAGFALEALARACVPELFESLLPEAPPPGNKPENRLPTEFGADP